MSLHSILRDRFDGLDPLVTDLTAYLGAYRYDVRSAGPGRIEILLPHRPPLPWHAPIGGRRLRLAPRRPAYEPVVTAALDWALERTVTRDVIDAGAEIGYFATVAASRDDLAVTAHAFEMRPDHVARLRDRAEALGLDRVRAHLAGLSDADLGERTVWYSVTRMFEAEPDARHYRDPWWIRLKMRARGRPDRDRLRRATVRIDSLDAFCAREGIAPGLVKIDVDGYEARVIPGGMATFAEAAPVLFLELHRHRFYRPHGVARAEVVRPLLDLGYRALLLTCHHDLARNRVEPLDADDARLGRDRTDFLILV